MAHPARLAVIAGEVSTIRAEYAALKEENGKLKRENQKLRKANRELKRTLSFQRGDPVVKYIARLTKGQVTPYKEGYDIVTKCGKQLEVKVSYTLNEQTRTRTKRWVWDRILGLNETKRFDFLLLAGRKDERYKAQYPPGLKWVFFLVPWEQVRAVTTQNCIGLNTNREGVRPHNSRARDLWNLLVDSEGEIVRRIRAEPEAKRAAI
jgi:regulator of replication initiation timing